MANKRLKRAGVPQELCDRLNRYHIVTCRDFLSLSLLELMRTTGQNYPRVQTLLQTVSKACAPKMITALEIIKQRSVDPSSAFLRTTLAELDEVLHGGLACGSLTEVTGPSGCGKTQFCMMMSVLATLPTSMGGLDGAVIYIDTESAFSAERLVEVAMHRCPQFFCAEEKLKAMTNSIHLYCELTCEDVLKRIERLEEDIISKGVKLVIVDSVASVVRKEFDTRLQGNLMERSNLLAKEASTLKYLAKEFSIPTKTQKRVKNDSGGNLWEAKMKGLPVPYRYSTVTVILTNQITTHLSKKCAAQADPVSLADDLGLSQDHCSEVTTGSLLCFHLHHSEFWTCSSRWTRPVKFFSERHRPWAPANQSPDGF
ncbi:DNA repair protein RAD51 homolog 2 isoform X3 [Latimeria chalumnae]|uniref:DNA repair protein RAD51 homolog 2 isoform X3 n=1 Tax=Latimeria chalumnae TaxID=7897 RepID=UPI00313D4F38